MRYSTFLQYSYKNIFFLLSFVLLIAMMVLSQSAGISGDEHFKVEQAEDVYNFYTTLGKDTTAVNPSNPALKYYGQSIDSIVYAITKNLNIEDYYATRHLFNSILGWLLMFSIGLTAGMIFGWRSGIITLVLIFLSQKILGHSWNNSKDIPFAAFYTLTILFLTKLLNELPDLKKSTLAFISIGIAGSISVRIGGLILIPYVFLVLGLFYVFKKDFYTKEGIITALKKALVLFGVAIVGYFLGLIFWPFGLINPIKNPIDSLTLMTHYAVAIRQLFEGTLQISTSLPWYYGIKYMFITTPTVIFVGIGLFSASLFLRKDLSKNSRIYFFLLFAFVFPLVYTIYKNSNLYGGWRHLLFAYPPIVVLSGLGFDYFIANKNKIIKYGALGLLILLIIHPLKHMIKNHPYEYVYYNELSGGVKGAYGEYELDYYYHSLQKACEWFIENELGNDTVIVSTNHGSIAKYAFRNTPNVKVEYARYYEKSKEKWDYGIYVNAYIDPHQLQDGIFPPIGTIHTEDVDGIPICAVFKRASYDDFEGFQALQKRKLNDAEEKFNKFLEVNPESEEVIGYKAQIHLMKKDYARASALADSALALNPNYFNAIFIKITACNGLKKYDEALKWSEQIIEIKQDHAETYYQRGFALYHLGKANDALKELQKAVNVKDDYYTAFMLMGEIFINYKKYDQAIKVIYPKVLSFRKNNVSAQARMALCYYLKKDETNANKILSQIPRKSMNRLDVVKLLTRMDLDKNNMAAAQRKINSMRRINNNSELEVLRAMFSIKLNDLNSANDYLDKAIELDKYNNEARELKNRIKPKTPSKNGSTAKAADKETVKPNQQSVMFQKPKKKKRSVFSQKK